MKDHTRHQKRQQQYKMAIANLGMTLWQCNFKSLLLADFGKSITVRKLFRQKNKSAENQKAIQMFRYQPFSERIVYWTRQNYKK